MSGAPTGFNAPKTNWATTDPINQTDLNRIEGNANATELGGRTLDQALTNPANVGTLRQILSWVAGRIRAITGATNWWDAPATTLATAHAHHAAVAPHTGHETSTGAQARVDAHAVGTAVHGAVAAPTANRLVLRDASGRAQVAAPSVAADIARLDTVTAHTALTNNPHAVTAVQTGAAPSIHVHGAADVTTGILPVVRGGTGIGSFTANNYVRALNATTLEQRTPAQVMDDVGGVSIATLLELAKRGLRNGGSTTAFSDMTVAPAAVGWGGSLVYAGGDFIYAFQGSTTGFWRYSIAGNSWTSMAVAPSIVGMGGSLVYTGGDFIYAFQGGATGFWRYSIAGNSWTSMAVAPAAVGWGGSLVYTGGDFIYAFQGNDATGFWRTSLLPASLHLTWQPWMK